MNKANLIQELRALAAEGMPDEPEVVEEEVVVEEPVAEGEDKPKPKPKKKAAPEPRKNGLLEVDFSYKGVHIDVQVNPENVVRAAELIDAEGLSLEAITGVDWLKDKEMELVYDYAYTGGECFRIAVRARIPRDTPDIDTVSGVFPGANWHERETYDFFGVNFVGHPQLENLLLPEDSDFHPLLKDFKGC